MARSPDIRTSHLQDRALPRFDAIAPSDRRNQHWEIALGDGPVVATAIHDGHAMRDSLGEWMAIDEEARRRDEDPLTGLLTTAGDVQVRVHTSRFEVDLNRPREKAISADPADTWGVRMWKQAPPQSELEQSLATYDRFYRTIAKLMDAMIERHGRVLLLDIHSYNHRRDGPDAPPAEASGNPEIDLGVTTLDRARFGALATRFADALRATPIRGHRPDVRGNVRYEGGGHFPEWLFRRYGDKVCAISLEYKKIFMDEWTALADIAVLEDLRTGLRHAVDAVRPDLADCR